MTGKESSMRRWKIPIDAWIEMCANLGVWHDLWSLLERLAIKKREVCLHGYLRGLLSKGGTGGSLSGGWMGRKREEGGKKKEEREIPEEDSGGGGGGEEASSCAVVLLEPPCPPPEPRVDVDDLLLLPPPPPLPRRLLRTRQGEGKKEERSNGRKKGEYTSGMHPHLLQMPVSIYEAPHVRSFCCVV